MQTYFRPCVVPRVLANCGNGRDWYHTCTWCCCTSTGAHTAGVYHTFTVNGTDMYSRDAVLSGNLFFTPKNPRNCVIGHTITALSPSDVSVWDTLKITFLYYFLTLSYISAVTSHKRLTGYFIVHTCYSFCSCCWGLWNWWHWVRLSLA